MKKIVLSHKGFTLIELSIVMVIIGLLIGGILTGRELIHIAGAKSIISQITSYNTAVSTFQVKYNALPGDMINAKSLIAGATQNGNGDGAIGYLSCSTSNGLGPSNSANALENIQCGLVGSLNGGAGFPVGYEHSSFWQHLSILNLISGNYTTSSTNGSINYAGTNMPTATTNNQAGILAYNNSGDTLNYYHVGLISAQPGTGGETDYTFLSPADAYYIDNKMDDGFPASGIVAAREKWNWTFSIEQVASYSGGSASGYNLTNSCVIGATYATSTAYNVANISISSQLCELRIRMN